MNGFTQVTAIVLDPTGNVYANASVSIAFVGQASSGGPYLLNGNPTGIFQNTFSGETDSFGNFSILLADNNQITPVPSQWLFSIVAAPGLPAFSVLITITGVSQNVTAAIQAAAAPLNTIPYAAPLKGGLTNVAFNANLVLNAQSTSGFAVPLTGNVSSISLTGYGVGQFILFKWTQDATGGRTITYPGNMIGFNSPSPTPNSVSTQLGWSDGINVYAISPMTVTA